MSEPGVGQRAGAILRRSRAIGGQIFGGRYSRGAWLVATLAYCGAVALALLPLSTYLWTSPRPLRDVMTAVAIVVGLAAISGLALSYSKRLQDQDLNGLWAAVPLVVGPWVLVWAAMTWGNHVSEGDRSVSVSDYTNIAAALALVIITLFGLRAGKDGDRFGRRVTPIEVLRLRHPAMILLGATTALVCAASLYAGFFQPGVWIGRQEYAFDRGTTSMFPGGFAFATCGGAKGVSAISQEGQAGGFIKDAVEGTWGVVQMRDGTLDIQTMSKTGTLSFRQDGFLVEAYGLKTDDSGRVRHEVDSFQVVAKGGSEAGDVRTVTTMNFVKMQYGYQAVISSSRVIGANSLMAGLSGGHPRASSYLMIADCNVFQD